MVAHIMAQFAIIALGIIPALLQGSNAQTWQSQINITMCTWYQFRANVIRDTIYLDGGKLWWKRGYSDGTYGPGDSNGNPMGDMYTLSLSTPFDTTTTNLTSLFKPLSKTGGTAANNIAPNYVDGTMFANDDVLYLYGGIVRNQAESDPPDEDSVLSYEAYQYGPAPRTAWRPGFIERTTNNGVTRYITNGAGVSAPSENLGFYMSGMRAPDWGSIEDPIPQPNTTSNRLISLDMSEMRKEKWDNQTLPDEVPVRANAELVWIPVSESGVLVAIGGVTYPEMVFGAGLNDTLADEDKKNGPDFMQTVAVYDIDTKKWFMQNTTGDIPPMTASFCSVVAAAQDGSSYNIYIYGGFDGYDPTHRPYDSVYVLSVPSFTWVKVYDGDSTHGRHGHKCISPYPDQMFVLGGLYIDSPQCIDMVQVFNLNNLKFQNTYDPTEWSDYEVPALVTAKIGGGPKGGANKTAPDSWADDALESAFAKKYTKEIKHYYPYPVLNETTTPTPTPVASGGGGGFPKWAGAVIGVVLGLILITVLVILWLVWRRRRLSKYAQSEGGNSDNRRRILGWMYGMGAPTQKPDMTVASTEIGINDKHTSGVSDFGGVDSVTSPHGGSTVVYSDITNPQEAASHQVHEMPGQEPGTRVVELPAEVPPNVSVTGSDHRARSPSDSTFMSPVSPAVSPTPDSQPQTRPPHARNQSSLSSTGFNVSLNNVPVGGEDAEAQLRPGYVSGFREEFGGNAGVPERGPP